MKVFVRENHRDATFSLQCRHLSTPVFRDLSSVHIVRIYAPKFMIIAVNVHCLLSEKYSHVGRWLETSMFGFANEIL